MRLLFDHNLSPKLARRLDDLYPGSTHTHLLGMGEEPDEKFGVTPAKRATRS
jgi:predicted nuclease of predicted toxin-antitoxin system